MAKKKKKDKKKNKKANKKKAKESPTENRTLKVQDYCSMPIVPERERRANMSPGHLELIVMNEKKWVNGTVLHYYFFDKDDDGETVFFTDGSTEWRTWKTSKAEKDVVRAAFEDWADLGIGVKFEEVDSRDEAEVRIGFQRGDGAWSYVGRDIIDLGLGPNERTMNFGWDLTRSDEEIDTAIHEIGHTLGLPHEHQNPFAGIVWDEEAVYAALAQPPNNWGRDKTFHNIIRKIVPDSVQGSDWDPDSVMHYPFGPGMILEPAEFRGGITPAGSLSARDETWIKSFYPPHNDENLPELKPAQSIPLGLAPGQQSDFVIKPTATRDYSIGTFGTSDTVIVLFEDDGGDLRYVTGDDDSGEDWNSLLEVKLFTGRRYVLRVRLYYADRAGETVVMIW
ncbi:MAG: hypothetical protein HKN25_05120 [Pyrinomonadaceae bacterium]|nr:hypothetical protein [Pyrinomonadaceae bacterium]